MRLGIISDIHANLVALQAVLAELDRRGVDGIYCLGDLVGYNARPNECVEEIRRRRIPCVMGNHDAVACGLEEAEGFNDLAREAALWTRDQLTEENKAFLRALPLSQVMPGRAVAVHGAPSHRDLYIFTEREAREQMPLLERADRDICFFGHTHRPNIFSSDGLAIYEMPDELLLRAGHRYMVNPGGVGQPRDNDEKACFAIYDTERRSVQFYRVGYDVRQCVEEVLAAGLPPLLAQRLLVGR